MAGSAVFGNLLWESGRDPGLSDGYGRMYCSLHTLLYYMLYWRPDRGPVSIIRLVSANFPQPRETRDADLTSSAVRIIETKAFPQFSGRRSVTPCSW